LEHFLFTLGVILSRVWFLRGKAASICEVFIVFILYSFCVIHLLLTSAPQRQHHYCMERGRALIGSRGPVCICLFKDVFLVCSLLINYYYINIFLKLLIKPSAVSMTVNLAPQTQNADIHEGAGRACWLNSQYSTSAPLRCSPSLLWWQDLPA
jgi:hypothetical protein